MYRLQVEADFSAAHQLRGHRGRCENLHGHNWRVRAIVNGQRLDELGMLMDFADLKQLLRRSVDPFDHCLLNGIAPFDRINPTSENLARLIAEKLTSALPTGVRVEEVVVWESDNCAASFRPQDVTGTTARPE